MERQRQQGAARGCISASASKKWRVEALHFLNFPELLSLREARGAEGCSRVAALPCWPQQTRLAAQLCNPFHPFFLPTFPSLSGSQGSGGQQLNRSLALLAAADTPGGQRLQLPPSLIHEVLAYPSAKTVGLTGGKQGKAKARTGTEAAGGAGARQGQGRSREATLFSHPISPANNCGSDFAGHWEEDFRGGLTPAAAGRTQGYADIFGWPTMGASQSPGFSPAQVGVPSPQDSGN
eukprot:1157216-Pelagomonas_calceolata.AAC.10